MNDGTATLRQRADLTFKFNAGRGRHGWLRLTPAYSVRVAEQRIRQTPQAKHVLDPFCGTGTTALCAIDAGRDAVTVDVNPFLVWLARAKTACYSQQDVRAAQSAGKAIAGRARKPDAEAVDAPAMRNIARWWTDPARLFLCRLRHAMAGVAAPGTALADLLDVAFCRTLIKVSNAAFNHQSMSFKPTSAQAGLRFAPDYGAIFQADLRFVLDTVSANPLGRATIVESDATDLPGATSTQSDLVVTSPPYANRMSYIRELRPYMYWLGYLDDARHAGELDWQAVGGTWGRATSRLAAWQANPAIATPEAVHAAAERIGMHDSPNSTLLANYVRKYFEDMARHLDGLPAVLAPGARLHYVVGNSLFYGVLVATEEIYAAMMRARGFQDVRAIRLRKRNSKKELVEFDVSATWPGH